MDAQQSEDISSSFLPSTSDGGIIAVEHDDEPSKKKPKRLSIQSVHEEWDDINLERTILSKQFKEYIETYFSTLDRYREAEHARIQRSYERTMEIVNQELSSVESTLQDQRTSVELDGVLREWDQEHQQMAVQLKRLQELLYGGPDDELE
jgi:hypothetical protein